MGDVNYIYFTPLTGARDHANYLLRKTIRFGRRIVLIQPFSELYRPPVFLNLYWGIKTG